MTEYLQTIASFIGVNTWVVKAFAVLLVALLLELLYRVFAARLKRLAERSDNLWDDALVYAGQRPVSFLIWWQGVMMAARVIAPHTEVEVFDTGLLATLQQLGLVAAATWFFFRLASGFEDAFIDKRRKHDEYVDVTTVTVIGRVVRIAVILTGVLTVLSILDIPISGFLAAGGVGGIAAGLAARDLLANFFGGLMVFMDRPFSVGDWVRSPDRDIEGVVEKLGWRITTIRKFDRRPMYVPNAAFTTITVENPSRMTHRRINEVIGVCYDDVSALRGIVGDVRGMLESHDGIDATQTLMVHFDQFADSSLNFFIYCFTVTTDWMTYHRVKEDVLLRISDIIDRHDAEIAYPTRSLKVQMLEDMAEKGSAGGQAAQPGPYRRKQPSGQGDERGPNSFDEGD